LQSIHSRGDRLITSGGRESVPSSHYVVPLLIPSGASQTCGGTVFGVPLPPGKSLKVFKTWGLAPDFVCKVLKTKDIHFQSIHSKGDRLIMGRGRERSRYGWWRATGRLVVRWQRDGRMAAADPMSQKRDMGHPNSRQSFLSGSFNFFCGTLQVLLTHRAKESERQQHTDGPDD